MLTEATTRTIIPIHEVCARKQQYATLHSDVYAGLGFNQTDPLLRNAAREVFAAAFGFPVHPDDISINCTSMDGSPGAYHLIYRASWDPVMEDVELRAGKFDGQITHLSGPGGTVTMSSGVGRCTYELAGFNPLSRRYVYAFRQEAAFIP